MIPFPDDPTSVDDLRPRCKRHHLLKHHRQMRVDELPDGTTRWTFHTGITVDERPEPLLPPPLTTEAPQPAGRPPDRPADRRGPPG